MLPRRQSFRQLISIHSSGRLARWLAAVSFRFRERFQNLYAYHRYPRFPTSPRCPGSPSRGDPPAGASERISPHYLACAPRFRHVVAPLSSHEVGLLLAAQRRPAVVRHRRGMAGSDARTASPGAAQAADSTDVRDGRNSRISRYSSAASMPARGLGLCQFGHSCFTLAGLRRWCLRTATMDLHAG